MRISMVVKSTNSNPWADQPNQSYKCSNYKCLRYNIAVGVKPSGDQVFDNQQENADQLGPLYHQRRTVMKGKAHGGGPFVIGDNFKALLPVYNSRGERVRWTKGK
jgi:hypothetical protein